MRFVNAVFFYSIGQIELGWISSFFLDSLDSSVIKKYLSRVCG